MREFLYVEPMTPADAVSALLAHGDGARILAGGTDLLRRMRRGEVQPQCLVSLARIAELKQLTFHPDRGLTIGAGVPISALEVSRDIGLHYPMLRGVAEHFGTTQVRSVGTVAGNICNASPAADFAPPLLALAAQVKVVGPTGERQVPIDSFFSGPGRTVLQPGDLVQEVTVPVPMPGSAAACCNHRTREMLDVSIVSVAAWVSIADGTCRDARIALGAVAPTPIRACQAEQVLIGYPLDAQSIARAAEMAMSDCRPLSDLRASAQYRRALVGVYTRRMLHSILDILHQA